MNSVSLYRDILLRSWHITRTYAYLWLFGFLAAFLGNGGELEFILVQFNKLSSGLTGIGDSVIAVFGTGGANSLSLLGNFLQLAASNYVMLGVVSLVLLILLWLVVSAQGALVRAVAHAGANGHHRFMEHFRAGSASFWKLLGILVLTRLVAFILFGIVGIPLWLVLINMADATVSLVVVSFVLGIPLFIIASLISKYAIAFHMLEHRTLLQSLARALELFFSNWLVSIELAVILFFLNLIVGGVIIVAILLFAVPFMLLAYVLQNSASGSATVFTWVGQVLAFVLLLLLGSILATFQYASWTELFLRIRKGLHMSKILRVIMHWRQHYRHRE